MRKQNFKLKYQYQNMTNGNVEVWFSEPKESSTQQDITTEPNLKPEKISEHAFLNNLWYYNLDPGQKLEITIDYQGSRRDKNYTSNITKEEKEFFLRSTNLIPVSVEIKKEALRIVEGVSTDIERAKKLFLFIIKMFEYSSHFSGRGVAAFKERKKGDCGEFGAIFCSYCRAIDIPARMLYGTWTLKKFSPHAWSEIYIENEGWIPVDPSMGRMKMYLHPFINISSAIQYGVFPNKKRYFGDHEGKRLAYSIDPERLLEPRYIDNMEYSQDVTKECIDGKEIAWGYESIEGKAPFLQPIYPKLHSKEAQTSIKVLFGEWTGQHTSILKNLTYKVKLASFNIGFLLIILEMMNDFVLKNEMLLNLLPLLAYPFLLLGTILSIVRNEGNLLLYVLGFFLTLSCLSILSNI
ncbi:transglutaminase-like domain-containing protein [Viridibacillus arvi]|uniref:transglutaminase-like domain-containing protein n=1 Tax=Viridibacillus arvi TaxID=263475 RepID=UPI003CFE94B7